MWKRRWNSKRKATAKLEAQPQLLEVARDSLRRWRTTNSAAVLRERWLVSDATPFPALLALLHTCQVVRVRVIRKACILPLEALMGVVEILLVPVVLVGRFVVEVAAVILGLFIWEKWLKQRA